MENRGTQNLHLENLANPSFYNRKTRQTDVCCQFQTYRLQTMSPDLKGCHIPDWVRWLAQDASGIWWGYEDEPHRHDNGWYENETGRCIQLKKSPVEPDWHKNLIKYNEYH